MSTNLQIVFFTLGVLLLTLGFALIFPFLTDLYIDHNNARAFGGSAVLAFFVGGGLCISNRNFQRELSIKYAFLLTTASWLAVSFFAALPFYFSDLGLSMTDAVFEAISGVTTTGATILSGLDDMSRGIILWRAISQWIGGIGIIAFAMIILPYLRIGGMQFFRSESLDRSEKIMPKTTDIVWSIVQVYVVLTAACFLSYYMLGMGRFEALVHALTTIPTGGFSSHDLSFGFYNSFSLHMAAAFFMVLGGVPFILYVKYVYQGKFHFFHDQQVRSFLFILGLVIAVMTYFLWQGGLYSFKQSLQYAVFNVISVLSTTGYSTTDYSLWGTFAVSVMFFLIYIGACAGSTAGGIKMLRINIAFQALNRHVKTLIYPSGVFPSRYQGKTLTDDIVTAVMGFLFLYVFFNVMLAIALTATGLDFVTAVTGAAAALANVGPGLGEVIGPAGNYASLGDSAKWMLCFGMLLGRLEVMTVLVLLTPGFWAE